MKKITKAIALLQNRPNLFLKRLVAEIRGFGAIPNHPVQKRINGILFEFYFSYGNVIRDMFLDKYEILTVAMMKKTLHSGDTFIDVGANIGYLSAVGAGLVGKSGEVHSFEPVPEYFQRAKKMATINPDYKIIINQLALGEIEGMTQIDIFGNGNIGWNTMVPRFMKPETRKQAINVSVRRLDNYIKEHNLKNITLIKVDVEGFEFSVLKGLKDFLTETKQKPTILCENNPQVCPLLGYHLKEFFDYMKGFGYMSYNYLNYKRLEWSDMKEIGNILFIPSGS
ncbi:MAG: FkbM family methyltransferase [Planctomycetota bacterium]